MDDSTLPADFEWAADGLSILCKGYQVASVSPCAFGARVWMTARELIPRHKDMGSVEVGRRYAAAWARKWSAEIIHHQDSRNNSGRFDYMCPVDPNRTYPIVSVPKRKARRARKR